MFYSPKKKKRFQLITETLVVTITIFSFNYLRFSFWYIGINKTAKEMYLMKEK